MAFFLLLVSSALTSGQVYVQSGVDSSVVKRQKDQQAIAASIVLIGTAIDATQWGKPGRSLYFFGASHFLQEDWVTGAGFLAGEIGLLVLRNKFSGKVGPWNRELYPYVSNDTEFRAGGVSPSSFSFRNYSDATSLLLQDVNFIDLYTAFRTAHEKTSEINKVNLHDDGVPSLLLSPFKPKYITNPWVFVPVILGCVANVAVNASGRPIRSASSVLMFDRPYAPDQAAALYGGVTVPRYLMVAAGEEMFFRGMLQTEFTELTSPAIGIGASSLLFGFAHIPNGGESWVAATLGGLYFAYRYRENGYDLGETIATHFWIDWLAGVIALISNPRDSQFVYSISWKL